MPVVRRIQFTLLAGLLITAAAVSGCGSSSPSSSTQTTGTGTTTATQTSSAATMPKKHKATAGTPNHAKPGKKLHVKVYHPTTNTQPGGKTTTTAAQIPKSGLNPCTLVTSAEAGAVLHAQVVRQIEAPLGPTCILELKGQSRSISLSVQAINVSRRIAHMKTKPVKLTIGGYTAYCGTLGSPILFVELGGSRVLQIVAPCAAAEGLAAKAIPRAKR